MGSNIKAKSNGVSLVEHSREVARFAVRISELAGVNDKNLRETIRVSALLHDIGKACSKFQHMLSDHDSELRKGNKYRHNEVGWAFLVNALPSDGGSYNKRLILNTVYWHHGISNGMNSYDSGQVMDSLSVDDVAVMTSIYSELLGNSNRADIIDMKAPCYFYSDSDSEMVGFKTHDAMIARVCVLSADRIVSSLAHSTHVVGDKLDELLMSTVAKSSNQVFNVPDEYRNDRFNKQEEIAGVDSNTCVVKAPAGFGKTLVGLLWSFKSNKKLLWVCPRNVVAESVYDSIVAELRKLNRNDSVELFLSGEVKECTGVSEGFESDVIVTNIDNFLTTSFDTRKVDKLYQIISCDVIFDEYHELVSEAGLFSCFISIMRARHLIVSAKTMMLSATPSLIHELWESNSNKTAILPDGSSHYAAAHDGKYNIYTHKDDMVDSVSMDDDTLVMLNSIRNVQHVGGQCANNIVLHSKFESKDRKDIMSGVFSVYGNNPTSGNKRCVVAAPVVQASVNVSFNTLRESVISPESTLQRIGRCNRWGKAGGTPSIHVYKSSDKGEVTCINLFYDKKLSDLWFDTISGLNASMVSLNELYGIYNSFTSKHAGVIHKYIKDKLKESTKSLVKIYPVKFDRVVKSGTSPVMTAGCNKLRSSGNEVFYIVKKKSGGYTEVFSKDVFGVEGFEESFSESGDKTLRDMVAAMKYIESSSDDRYSYSGMISDYKNGKLSIDNVRKNARKSNTPYIAVNFIYDDKLGIIDKTK